MTTTTATGADHTSNRRLLRNRRFIRSRPRWPAGCGGIHAAPGTAR
jgi:hypothetical protein